MVEPKEGGKPMSKVSVTDFYYNVQDVMELLHVSDETVYRWIKAGRLKAVRVGRSWRVSSEELERALGRGGSGSEDKV